MPKSMLERTHPEIGGTIEPTVDPATADRVVCCASELQTAIESADRNATIYVRDDAEIDLTSAETIHLPAGVTLASGRGRSDGALVFTDDHQRWLFRSRAPDVRVTGLRIRGPRTEQFDPRERPRAAEQYYSCGLHLFGTDPRVDNCELWGWPHAAIAFGAKDHPITARADHNTIHHNRMETLGYGVELYDGWARIDANYFDYNRHAVTAFGHETNGFVACNNLVGKHPLSHAFDMHRLSENVTCEDELLAGKTIRIVRNTVAYTHDTLDRPQEAVDLRGVTAEQSLVDRNWFAHEAPPDSSRGAAVRQGIDDPFQRLEIGERNSYGPSPPDDPEIGCRRRNPNGSTTVERLRSKITASFSGW
ncbi:right-handed parallel beta-helix repeat-containing protein [Halocatena halophila]|uniref:hypothetical protein n=1 Tax=Halocatena halophila TaxID=2814576 RepID=UPI002ED11A34